VPRFLRLESCWFAARFLDKLVAWRAMPRLGDGHQPGIGFNRPADVWIDDNKPDLERGGKWITRPEGPRFVLGGLVQVTVVVAVQITAGGDEKVVAGSGKPQLLISNVFCATVINAA
jgi:hypothetical protein